MKKMFLAVMVSLFSVVALPAMAAGGGGPDVSAAATAFQNDFGTAAAAIGTVLIGAAFVAIVYKWIKAMVFGG